MTLKVETEDGTQFFFKIPDGTKNLEVNLDKEDCEVLADDEPVECEAMKV